jgi:4-hydroxyphenylpyruvate dioxygenase-like putative hemolysin
VAGGRAGRPIGAGDPGPRLSTAHDWIPEEFGGEFDLPLLGARAREVKLVGGTLRIIMPTEPNGLAAQWLAEGGPRWIGFAVAVDDLESTTQRLAGQGVQVLRRRERKQHVGIVLPEATGGTMLELVELRER